MSRRRPLVLLATMGVILVACSSGASAAASAGAAVPSSSSVAPSGAAIPSLSPSSLTIYAAASLKGALNKAKSAWERAYPGSILTISTDSSSALETQIEQGAPADVFLSADITNPQKLVDRGLAVGDALPFAANELTVIVPTTNPAGIMSPADLARTGVKIIAAGNEVPITKYASQLVANLAKEPGYPTDFSAACAANIASKEDNVKAVVAKIELGEGDAGIVYVTDARASSKVATIDVPEVANVPATYAGVVVKASSDSASARAFLTWLAGPDGQAILAGFGFLPPS